MIHSAFTDGSKLICLVPADGKIWLISAEAEEDALLIGCPACPGKVKMIKEIVTRYRIWRWWEGKRPVFIQKAHITLQAHWQQIPVPGTIQEITSQTQKEERYAAEYFGYCP